MIRDDLKKSERIGIKIGDLQNPERVETLKKLERIAMKRDDLKKP